MNINAKIRSAEVRGQSPNDLLDQRQRMLNDLSMLIDVQPGKQTNFDSDVSFVEDRYQLADGFLTFATVPLELKTVVNDEGMLLINRVGKQVEFPVTTGRLGGLLEARNGLAEKYLTSFNEFASVLIGRLDTIHATGVGLNKGFSNLVGQRSVSDINAPLSSLELFSPIQQGNLYVTVIAPDGTKSLHELAINPDTQSTSDLADAFDAIPNLQGIADAASGTLTVLADPDYQFNFTGAVPNQVDDSSMSGTSRPDFSGIYTGVQNRKLTFQFAEDGTIGQPEELRVNVIDQSGSLVATLDLGNEYEPGTELLVTDGVEVAFAPGTVVNGDSFQVDLIADPDTTGVLAALGINSLFEGSALGDLAVNSSILRDPSLLATRHSGDALDTTNATRLLRVRGESLFSNGTQTAHEYFTEIIALSGVAVAELAADEQSLTVAANALEEKRQGLSGVDPNEEVVRMLQFQRSFQAAARYISSVEETLDELFNILR